MGQRGIILAQIWGFYGWIPKDVHYEQADGQRVEPVAGYDVPQEVALVLEAKRRWRARCDACGALCRRKHSSREAPRRWQDLPWAGRPAIVEYAPCRVRCDACGHTGVERLPWAERHQRQTQRLQQHLALDAASMPVNHVAVKYGLSWATVRRAEGCALERWLVTRPVVALRISGVDEKYLGRRRKSPERFVTIVSNNETGEPLWIGFGRAEATLTQWLQTLSKAEKSGIQLFVMDMHKAFENAVRADPDLAHAKIAHDVFHVMKRAGQAMDELRRALFFRAGPELRALGRGKRWLLLRAWERTTDEQRRQLRELFRRNGTLSRFYQVVEELREALHAPDRVAMAQALRHILKRTQNRTHAAIRGLHDSIKRHWDNLVTLAEFRPATGRVEALNNNWETLVRRGRGYRDLPYLLLKLRFACANPVRTDDGVKRFIALGLPPPIPVRHVA